MEQRFGDSKSHGDAISETELPELLHRLESDEVTVEIPDHHATIAAVCEATGESEARVRRVLQELRAEDIETRLSARLMEAEEPLHRVERPGKSGDPLTANRLFFGREKFSRALEGLEASATKVKRELPKEDKLSKFFAFVILLLIVGLTTAILINAAYQGQIPPR